MRTCFLIFLLNNFFLGFKGVNFAGIGGKDYSFAAAIPAKSSGCSAEALVPAQAQESGAYQGAVAGHLPSVGQASLPRLHLSPSHCSGHGAPTMEMSMWPPQQEGCPDMRFLSLGLCANATGLAMEPTIMASVGSAATGETAKSQQHEIHQFESNRSIQSILSYRSWRPRRSTAPRQPQTQGRQAEEIQSSTTKASQRIKVGGKRRCRWSQAISGACLVFQSAQVASSAHFYPDCSNIVLGRRSTAHSDWFASQVSGSAHTGNSGLPHIFDGQGHPFHCEVITQLGDQAREGPECPDRSSRRQASASQQVEELRHRGGGQMDPIHRGVQEGRPDIGGTDPGSERRARGHQGTVCSNSDAVGHGWTFLHRDLRRGREQDGCGICQDIRWFGADDGIPDQPQADGRSDGRRTAEGCQKTPSGRDCNRGLAFCRARQDEALGSACQGRQLGTFDAVVAYWSHSICDEPSFMSTWAARFEGLQAAFDLGLPTTASFTPSPQRCGKRSGPKKVSFSTTIRLQFCAAESLLSASMDLSEEAFNHWPAKPWSLRQRSISTSIQPHPHDALSVEMRGNALFHDSDEGSFVQAPPIKRLRNEHQVPDWQAFGRQGDHSDDDPDDGSSEHSTSSEADHSSQRSTSHEPQEDAISYNDGVVRTVLLYWRENPAIHAQISSIHAEGQLAEIAEHIGIPRHELVQVYRVNVDLPHIPTHITPLIVHHLNDFVPGEAVALCLVDVEIHGNRHEVHYASFPAVDRRVVIMPQRLTRRLILEFSLTLPYCQRVQHRCLVMFNDKPLPLQDDTPFWVSHGDYIVIRVPPDEACADTTSYLMADALREARRSLLDSPLATPQDGYSPSLVPSEEIRHEFGRADDEDAALIQTSLPMTLPLTDISAKILNVNDADLPLDSVACISTGTADTQIERAPPDSPLQRRLSWTEEFLRAMGALQTAQEDMPEELRGEAHIPAAHGDVFNLIIQRDVTVDIHTLIGLPDPHLRQRLAALLEQGIHYLHVQDGERPDLPAVLAPDWFSLLEQVFDAHAASELLEEGPVLYIHTWFLDAMTTNRCPVSRPARLLQDRRTWRSALIAVWQDQIHTHQPIDFAFVDPAPPRLPWMSPTAHLLLTQRADPVHASVLVSAINHQADDPVMIQAMHYLPQRVSGADVIDAHMAQTLSGPCRVRRGPHVFPAIQAVQIGNGDSLEIDLPPSATVQASADTDALNLLQRQAAITRRKVHPVLLSLDAVIPPNQDADLTKIRPPEVLFSEEDDWHNRLCDMELHFAPLPENLDLRATTLHALQDPASYIESSFAGRLALYVDGSARGHAAAWSVIAVEYDGQGLPTLLGALSGQVELNHSSTQWIGATNADNVAAELTASIAAHLAAIALGHPAFTVIRPDLKLSAMLSTSTWSCHSHSDLAAIARWLGAWFAQGGGTCNEVRGHSAHPWNDLADSVARHALSVVTPVGAVDFDFCHQLLISGDIAWAWIGLQPPCYEQCLPPNGVSTSWLAQPSLRKVGAPPSSSVPSEGQWHQVQFTIASANVLAISSDLPAFPAESASSRAERLDQQWHQQQIAVIGLQESRRAAGRYATTHYHVFASGATQDGGAPHGGCELWLHKHLPFLSAPEHSLSFAQLRPAISCADSRRLVLHLHSPQFSCSFVVLHAPCRSQHTSLEEVATWWRQTTDLLDKAELAPMTWLFVDANAPLATGACENFGDHGSESTNEQGHLFEQFILTGRWFAPTTMSWCHIGPHATWTHPRGQRLRRDYVLCSAQAFQWCNSSWTDQAYDGGFAHEDHVPVCLQHSGWWYVEQSAAQHQWDRCAFLDPVTCDAFQQALATLPVPSWTVNINDHADHFQHGVMQLARQFFTKKSGERVRPRLSEPTLALIQLKRSFLDYARAQSCIQDEDVKTELRSLERIIRARVQADHRLFYDQLVHQLAQDGALHDFRSVYQLLSRLGGRPRHKSGKGRPLPLLKTEDGRVVTSFQDQQRLWLRQFAAVEGGVPVARQTLPTLMPAALGLPAERLDLTAIPTCEQLASKIRKMKRGKAPGPDGLPAEIFKAGALPMLHHVVAMTTKTAIHAREPNSWRGGRLIPLHKGKTARSDPTGYRSIFVSNFVTKLYHSVLRDHLVDVWHHALSHLQFGGRKGCSSDTPHLLVQQHFEYAHARKLPSAALFVDFKSAFYTVIRQGLFSDSLDETTFMVAMHRLGVAPQDLVELLSTAAQDEATKGLSSHVQALLTDLFRGTYFELDGLSEVALTSRGTRPGDPVGDILFNLVMAIVLKDITFSLQEASSAMWLGSPTPVDALHHHAEPPVFAFYEVAFVDDLAVLMRAADIEQLLDFAAQALQAVHNAAGRRGLSLNMQAGKTELICALVGPGARKAKIQLASQQNLHPVTLGGKLHHLRLVHAYKHLGGWVHADAQPRHTVRERLTSARQAWGPLVRPFFAKLRSNCPQRSWLFNRW